MEEASTSSRIIRSIRCFKLLCGDRSFTSFNLTGQILNRDIKPSYRNTKCVINISNIPLISHRNPTKVTRYIQDSMFENVKEATVGLLDENQWLVTGTRFQSFIELFFHDIIGPLAVLKSIITLDAYSVQVFNTFSKTLLIWSWKRLIEQFYTSGEKEWNFRVTPTLLYIPIQLQIDIDIPSVLYDRGTRNSKNILHPCKNGFLIVTCDAIQAVRIDDYFTKVDDSFSNFTNQMRYMITCNTISLSIFLTLCDETRSQRIQAKLDRRNETVIELAYGQRITLKNVSDRCPNRSYTAELATNSLQNGLSLIKNSLNLENVINHFVPESLRERAPQEVWKLLGTCDYEADILEEIEGNVVKILIVSLCEIHVTKCQNGVDEVKNEFHVFSMIANWNFINGVISVNSVQPVKTVLPHDAMKHTKWYPFKNFPQGQQNCQDWFEMPAIIVAEEETDGELQLKFSENPQNDGRAFLTM